VNRRNGIAKVAQIEKPGRDTLALLQGVRISARVFRETALARASEPMTEMTGMLLTPWGSFQY